MEDDNALDIVKWLFRDGTRCDLSGELYMLDKDTRTKWEARLKGNLLGLKAIECVTEPCLLVCEKVKVERSQATPNSLVFSIKYGPNELVLEAPDEDELFKWMVQLAICSHQKSQAELDSALNEFNIEAARASAENRAPTSPLSHFFLTSPLKKEHTFSIFNGYNMPNRTISCEEVMYESKLCTIIPSGMVRIFISWWSDLRSQLLQHLANMRNASMDAASHHVIRHLNSNLEVYSQMREFLDDYHGPSFRPSKDKFLLAFSPVPTNLHVQVFNIGGEKCWTNVTSGAICAAPLRFKHGGLSKLRDNLMAGLDPKCQDHILETRFFTRRKTLLNAKKKIGELTRRIENDWTVGDFGKVDKVGIKLFSEVKQLHELVVDLINSFPNVHNLVDALTPGGLAQLQSHPSHGPKVAETLSTQLDALDAAIISLNSKIAVIDRVDGDEAGRVSYKENAKTALNSVLDMLLQLVDSFCLAQLLALITALRNGQDAQNYFHIQLRYDMIISQAVTLIATCLLITIETLTAEELVQWEQRGPLITLFAFLSCYGDEKGMMEDMREVWSVFYGRVRYRFIPLNSTVSKTCVPQVDGENPTDVEVSVPLPAEMLSKLPPGLRSGEWFRVQTIYWNVGVNHEATLAMSVGDLSLEGSINLAGLALTRQYVSRHECTQTQEKLLDDLRKCVEECPTKKNVQIFPKVQALTRSLAGCCVIACKSGKDRSSMAVTWDQGNALRENFGIPSKQAFEMVDCLRRDGVRRENCRKNVGKAMYSFSPFQMHFLPKEMRPPSNTYTHNVSS